VLFTLNLQESSDGRMSDKSGDHLEDLSIWDGNIAAGYDTSGVGMFADKILTPTVSFLEQLVQNGHALEFAIGTGRVAIPLYERGIRVAGIDYSAAMVEVLHGKIGQDAIPVAIGDMTCTRVEGDFSLVYLVYNGLSNLLTQQAQVECMQNAARHLPVGGRFVVEMWIPELRKLPPGQNAVVWEARPGYIGLDTYDVPNQLVTSHHLTYDQGGKGHLYRSRHRYVWPSEQDLMASLAGFDLEDRFADWNRAEFDADATSQIAVYVKR